MLKRMYFLLLFTIHSASALITFHVSQSTDNNPGDKGEIGDLRFCLNTMNEALNAGTIDDYAIEFDFPMTIQLNGILPIINNSPYPVNLTIGNPGSIPTVTLDGNSGAYPGFFIPMGNVTIQNMIFQNLTAHGGNGGNGIAGGGGGMGAGGAIYIPNTFLDGSFPSITLINVTTNNCSAVGGNGGNYMGGASTGNEGGGGGGGFAGNGGNVTGLGSTGGGGGGGFGGNGGSVFLSTDNPRGGGGGGGGGIGSRATMGSVFNSGNGGSDVTFGDDGNGYGLTGSGGNGGGGYPGGIRAGGAGGGGALFDSDPYGGGGGGSNNGDAGLEPLGSTPPGGSATPSGGNGKDGGGGGGGAVVKVGFTNSIDGKAGSGGYAGGGGGGSGTGATDAGYTVQGSNGGTGGGGGAGGVDQSGTTSATGGNSLGGGGGGAGGPGNGSSGLGGIDTGSLGGGAGGTGASTVGAGFGGGSGGGGSGLGGAIFVDSNLNLTIQAFAGTPTTFNTQNGSTQAGLPGSSGSGGGTDGTAGSALGNSIFLRQGSSLTFNAANTDDLLTLGDQVAFVDDTTFGAGGTNIFVQGNGTVVYNGTTTYAGNIMINNANFKVTGLIEDADVNVCRNSGFSDQRGTLSGSGTLTGNVFANSGTISPDTGETLTLGSLSLNGAGSGSLGSLVEIAITASGDTSLVAVTGAATLAGTLNITLNPSAPTGTYVILTSSGITGTFDAVTFTGPTPNYTLSYLPEGSPTFVQFEFQGFTPDVQPASNFRGVQLRNDFGFEYELYNELTWTASTTPEVAGYFISRDGTRIATVNAATLSYQDHNRPAGTHAHYSLVAFDGDGNTSSPVNVTVP